MHIQFLGATQTVTGSKYLIQTDRMKVLVDSGLFQGHKALRLRNWASLPVDPKTIDYVLLTHAHIDHSGYIPLLVKHGFRGKILCTDATYALCRILLPDSGYLQEEEARYANHKKSSKHHPALPLYTEEDAEKSLEYFETVSFHQVIKLHEGFSCQFFYAGHILGASSIRLEHEKVSILFSGDVGRPVDPIMRPPEPPPSTDYLVIESTYGDRQHPPINPEKILQDLITRTSERGGTILIPSFAVGRAQSILFYLYQLQLKHAIPRIPIFVDSPMAADATQLFYRYADQHRLSKEESAAVCHIAQYIHSTEESMALNQHAMPKIIISASGMATGGRVIHHLRHLAPDHRNSILFAGYQASGTRGDRVVRGEKEIKIFGQMIPVRAEVVQLENISAHADYEEICTWLNGLHHPPRKVFITHGEEGASMTLKAKLEARYHWSCDVPTYLEKLELT